jgi:hypothetical protein
VIRQDTDLWLAKWEAGQSVWSSPAKNRKAFVHVADGEAEVHGRTPSPSAAFTTASPI